MKRRTIFLRLALLVLPAVGLQIPSSELSAQSADEAIAPLSCPPACGLLYFVDSTGDGGNVGSSNFCDDGTGHCTLRAAIEASNLHPGVDGIEIGIPTSDPGYNGTFWTINLTQVLPDLSEGVSISGPGASALVVRRGAGGEYRIFNVTTTGTVTFSGLTINNGLPPNGTLSGGGIQNLQGGTVNVTDSTLTGNIALDGGAISNNSTGTVNVINSTISGNSGGDIGGGIANLGTGTVNVTNSAIDDNHTSTNRDGGGIYNVGIVSLRGSTVSRNLAGSGGGIFNSGGTVDVTNSTISGNTAAQTGFFGGGGILNFAGTANVTNSTISSNIASDTGGILNHGSTVTVKSSIIASNTGSTPDISGPFTSSGFNLVGKTDGGAGFTAPTDQTGTVALPVDPKLDSNGLQDNGGPTETIALLFGSPAIDTGTSNGLTGQLTTDQRGAPRVAGVGCDIGAFELPEPAASLGALAALLALSALPKRHSNSRRCGSRWGAAGATAL